jgi:hypothetical protein
VLDFDLYEYYRSNKEHNIILTFKGALSQEILVEMGSMIKNQFAVEKHLKKIFSVFVELAQNIMHYSAEKERNPIGDNEVGIGIIIFSQRLNHYVITSGNMITKSQKDRIKSKIDFINSLNEDELKQYYSEQRRKPQEDGSKGAGLGFVDIARKSNNKIEYQINPLENDLYFLVISVNFERGIE